MVQHFSYLRTLISTHFQPHKISSYFLPKNKGQEYTAYLDIGESDIFTATMPEEAENGERIAIVFIGLSGYDYWSGEPQDDYGGKVWYTWIYTFTK